MPIIFEDESKKDVSTNRVIVPREVSKNIKNTLAAVGDSDSVHRSKGYKRAKTLISPDDYNKRSLDKNTTDDGRKMVTFGNLKRIAHDMRHMPQNKDNLQYILQGGDTTRNWVEDKLGDIRGKVSSVGKVNPVPPASPRGVNQVKQVKPVKMTTEGKKRVFITEKQIIRYLEKKKKEYGNNN